MFNLGIFVEDCRAAAEQDPAHLAVSEIMERAFADPAAVTAGLGSTPTESRIVPIYKSSDLTIMPHNHEMWAVIGVSGGREDNIFWRRVKGAPDGRIEAAGAKAPSTGAIHVYGGPFVERSERVAEYLTEQAYDMAKAKGRFRN